MNISLLVLAIPMYFILIGIEFVVTRIQAKKLYRLNDALTNISCGITEQVSGVFAKVAVLALYELIFRNVRLFDIPNTAVWIVVLFFAVDLCYYWAHRMSHEINLFWAGHVVHHQSEDYNLSVALRQGAFQKFFTSFFYLPLAFLGFDPVTFLIIGGINTLYQFWIHTETIGKLGPLEWVFNTPSHHRVHHGKDPKYIDKNHAGVFIIWDRIFGTFQEEEERPVYGITQPANTWNPVYAQVQHFERIWIDLKQVPGIWNKIQLLFRKPGWLPEEMGGYRAPQEVDRSAYRKFEIRIPQQLNYYLLVQYIIVLAGVAFFLFMVPDFSFPVQLAGASLIFIAVASLGLLLEGKPWAVYLEYGRLVATIVFLGYLFRGSGSAFYLAVSFSAILAFASIFWVRKFRPLLANLSLQHV
jgi:sterol desaturase/sphingolipid hydroxylase (fatty acid hydroxylase superfamily)